MNWDKLNDSYLWSLICIVAISVVLFMASGDSKETARAKCTMESADQLHPGRYYSGCMTLKGYNP